MDLTYKSTYYEMQILQHDDHCSMRMQSCPECIRTGSMPQIPVLLKEKLASILDSKCFNPKMLPFEEEVKNTELGHLFEHILLEYLCDEKIKSGTRAADYRGRTHWDWKNSPMGEYLIDVNVSKSDLEIMKKALEKTHSLMDELLNSQTAKLAA